MGGQTESRRLRDKELVVASLERLAERFGDPVDAVYQRYFTDCPESAGLMAHVDACMRGRMLTEVLQLLMDTQPGPSRLYLDFEVRTHSSYGVMPWMYVKLLGAVHATVRDLLGDEWDADFEGAWQRRIAELLEHIERRVG